MLVKKKNSNNTKPDRTLPCAYNMRNAEGFDP